MKTTILILSAVLLLSLAGCGPASKLKRAEKLIKKAELQGAVWSADTVFKDVPVFLRETRVDSIFTAKPGDTVFLSKDRLQVKYVRLAGDTVLIEAACIADTVYTKVPVNVYKTITAKGRIKWWHVLAGFVIGVVVSRIVVKMLT